MSKFQLVKGDPAPDFTLPDSVGSPVSLAGLKGSKVIVYFYPAAATPGCTSQACDFRDNFSLLQRAGYSVLGVSKDSSFELAKFAADEKLNFPLLSDVDLGTHRAYGAYGEKSMYGKTVVGVIRSTFVIAEDGTILEALYNVKATGHVTGLRKKLGLISE